MIKIFTVLKPYSFIIIFLVLRINSYADDHSNARGVGMAFGSMVSSFGVDAYGINPANFDLHKKTIFDLTSLNFKTKKLDIHHPKLEITIMSLGGGYGSDTTMGFYNTYLKYLSINRTTFTNIFTDLSKVVYFRDTILPGSRTAVNYDFELKWLSVNYSTPKLGALNFTISDKVGLNTYVDGRDVYFPLNFHVNIYSPKYDIVNVNLNQSEASAWWIRKYNISYAKNFEFKRGVIKAFSFGVSAAYVTGFGNVITYTSTLNLNTYGVQSTPNGNHVDSISGTKNFNILSSLTDQFQDYKDGAKSHYDFFPKPAGKGYSFDLGFNMQLGEKFRIAASVTELGSITWNYNTKIDRDTNSFIYRNFLLNSSDPTYNTLVNNLDGIYTRDTVTNYKTKLPTKYRAGVMYQANNKLLVELDWLRGENDFPSNSTNNYVAIGSEYYALDILPLRAGVSIGGYERWKIAFGAGIRYRNLVLDLAVDGINNIIANKRLSLAFSTKFIL